MGLESPWVKLMAGLTPAWSPGLVTVTLREAAEVGIGYDPGTLEESPELNLRLATASIRFWVLVVLLTTTRPLLTADPLAPKAPEALEMREILKELHKLEEKGLSY